jgi:hypothetical protein
MKARSWKIEKKMGREDIIKVGNSCEIARWIEGFQCVSSLKFVISSGVCSVVHFVLDVIRYPI